MLLVDTSLWIDMFRRGEPGLVDALGADLVEMHPMVLGELALGNLSSRSRTLSDLASLPMAAVASDDELVDCIDRRGLHGRGIGYVDAHLLASCLISGSTLWTRDRRLHGVAVDVGVA